MNNFSKIALCSILTVGCIMPTMAKKKDPFYVPEESGLNLTKITDESKGVILGPAVNSFTTYKGLNVGRHKKHGMTWSTLNCLSISPDGEELAYLARVKGQQNIFVRKAGSSGNAATTQRTFRNVGDFTWGTDGKLYFIDMNDTQNKICSIDSHKGSMIGQITSNNFDFDPVLTSDGTRIFFTRFEGKKECGIWCYDLVTNEFSNCASGFQPAIVPGKNDEFYCTRINSEGNSEIWHVNFEKGRETLILTDTDRGYSSVNVSPDGKLLAVVGNTKSTSNKKKNLDIFTVGVDGTNLTQITFHSANDISPRWSPDGKYIFFISDRGAEQKWHNIWRLTYK